MKVDIIGAHYNDAYWYKPEVFEPTRFDIESAFYKEAAEAGMTPHSLTKRGFGLGMRSCPGQTFSFLEIKVVLAVLLSFVDYEVDPQLLKQEGVGFGIGSEVVPMFRVTKL